MPIDKTMIQLSELLEQKKISSVEISEAFLKRIKSLNEKINAYITINEDKVLKDARASDLRREKGNPLSKYDGIPLAIKDNICTSGTKTTCASKILKNFIPPFNAGVYEKLLDMGFLLLGKTNMDEFAMGSSNETSFFGPVKNPFDLNRVPGGSSGGSAAAVSAMMCPAALGSDTGGSIRLPAAFCGVVGIKPTYGRVSRYGLVSYASSLDQIGTFGRTVDDTSALLAAISGGDRRDSTSIDRDVDFDYKDLSDNLENFKIGIPEEYYTGVDPEIVDIVNKKISALEEAGAKVEKISLKYKDYAVPVYYLIATAEASSNLARYDGIKYGTRAEDVSNLSELYIKSRSEGFGTEVKRRIMLGTFSLSSGYYDAYYLKALKVRTMIIEDFKNAFSKVDAIITPTTTSTAFKLGEMISDPLEMYVLDILTISANLAGVPGVSVPVGMDKKGLPIGLQIMGNHFCENKILSIAKAIEKVTDEIRPEV